MMDTLLRQVIVRHREAGHLRLQLPAVFSRPAVQSVLADGLRTLHGVYRTDFSAMTGGVVLSLHYEPLACHEVRLIRALPALLGAALAAQDAAEMETLPTGQVSAFRSTVLMLESLIPEAIASRLLPLFRQSLSEQAILNFLNDMVAFYLVRVHWDLITQRWLRQPLQFRKAWMAVFYLIFLLVRFRRQMQKANAVLMTGNPRNAGPAAPDA